MAYKLVQLTDCHLFAGDAGQLKGVNTDQALAAVVADVRQRHADLDALLVTGDLSQDETPASYDRLADRLAPLAPAPIHVLPGNHDSLAGMRTRLVARGLQVLGDLVLGRWRIVSLNSRVAGQPHGRLGGAQIEQLRRLVAGYRGYLIVALHHPPLAVGSVWLDALRCADGEGLLEAVAGSAVRAVICGHVHQQFEACHGELAVLTTPATCVQFLPGSVAFALDPDAGPGYRVLELDADGGWRSHVQRV